MIYKFRCKVAGDVIMLGPNGHQVLTLIGKTPAPQGIIEPAAMAAAIDALHAAIAADDALRAHGNVAADDAERPDPISLHQRAWPFVEMLKRALAADEPVVW